jgi:hypothetical protein
LNPEEAKMRLRFCLIFLLAIALSMAPNTSGQSQRHVPTDAEITQLRKNIEAAEREQPPPMYLEQHRRDTGALRLRLRDALQAQRRAMADYLERVRTLFPDRVAQIEKDIQSKDQDIEAATSSLLADGPAPNPSPAPSPNPGSNDNGNSNANSGGGGGGALPTLSGTGQGVGGDSISPATILPPPGGEVSGALAEAASAKKDDQLAPCGLVGPNSNHSEYEKALCSMVSEIRSRKSNTPAATVTIGLHFFELQEILAAKLIGRDERGKFLTEAEEARTDKQTGSEPSNAGSTSLVVKGGTPTILGFAVENGALVQSQSGTTVTFRGNPIGISKLLNNKTFDEAYLSGPKDPGTNFLKKTSFAFSFDTSRGQTPGVFTGDRQQLSSYSVRYEFKNDRDPRNPKHDKAFKAFLSEHGDDLALAVNETFKALVEDVGGAGGAPLKANKFRDPVLQTWYDEMRKLIAAAGPADVEATLKSQLDKFPTIDKLDTRTRSTVDNFTQHFAAYLDARKKLMAEIAKGSVITLEYTNTRNVNSPDLSNLRFIAETGIFGGKGDLTSNASLTFLNSKAPAGTRRMRDFQFAGQLDVPVKVSTIGSFVFSFAGKYERAVGDVTALDGTVLPNTRGDIAVGQLKLTIPIKQGSGVTFPISFTFANRTELVREKEVRGNFGLTFDLDKILAKFKPF